MIHVCSLNSLSPPSIRIYRQYKDIKSRSDCFCQHRAFCQACGTKSNPFSLQLINIQHPSGWLHFFFLHCTMERQIVSVKDLFLRSGMDMAWNLNPVTTKLHMAPTVSTKGLTYTWPSDHHTQSCIFLLSLCNFSAGMDMFQKQTTESYILAIFTKLVVTARSWNVASNCTQFIVCYLNKRYFYRLSSHWEGWGQAHTRQTSLTTLMKTPAGIWNIQVSVSLYMRQGAMLK